jgi:uncharacterized repeat protein (TIGR02543 family)
MAIFVVAGVALFARGDFAHAVGSCTITQFSDFATCFANNSAETEINVAVANDIDMAATTTLPIGKTINLYSVDSSAPRILLRQFDNGPVLEPGGNNTILTVRDIILDGNSANSTGFRNYIRTRSDATTITNDGAVLRNNTSTQVTDSSYGAAIHVDTANLIINGGLFQNNQAQMGGAIYCYNASNCTINGGIFENNISTKSTQINHCGGAISVGYNSPQLTIGGNAIFRNNISLNSGGAVCISARNNYNGSKNGSLIISGSVQFINNTAKEGGAIYIDDSADSAQIDGATFTGNVATANGGAIGIHRAALASLTVGENTVFSDNSAPNKYRLLATDASLYAAQIAATDWSLPAPYVGYNNFDIEYTGSAVVSFETGGGSAVAEQVISVNGTAVRPANPTRDHFTFSDWYTDEELTTTYDFDAPVTGDLVLYAEWTEDAKCEFDNAIYADDGNCVEPTTPIQPDEPTKPDETVPGKPDTGVMTTTYGILAILAVVVGLSSGGIFALVRKMGRR